MLRIKFVINNKEIKNILEGEVDTHIKDYCLTKGDYFDIIFYEIKGIHEDKELSQVLEKNEQSVAIIIGADEPKVMQESYSLQTLGYIRNTAIQEDVETVLEKLSLFIQKRFQTYQLKSQHGRYKIRVDTINYIESYRNHITIHANSGSYVEYKSLRTFFREIDAYYQQFIQVHKSYIVNLDKIMDIKNNTILLYDKSEIPIGRSYKETVVSTYIKK